MILYNGEAMHDRMAVFRAGALERRSGRGGQRGRPAAEPAKVAYLSSLTIGELSAFCSGVLSRAAVTPGDPDEIAEWMELVRLTADRARRNERTA